MQLENAAGGFISTARPTVHTNHELTTLITKTELFKNASSNGRIKKTQAFRKRRRRDNHVIFFCLSFPQAQFQNDRWLLCFQIPPA